MNIEFESNGFVLCVDQDGKTCRLKKYDNNWNRVVEIPASFVHNGVTYPLTMIDHSAFFYNSAVRKVIIPQGVEIISTQPFWKCVNLEEVVIPDSVTAIRGRAFYGCVRLKSVVIPEGVREIDYRAFENCTRLEHIELPTTLTSLGHEVFKGCEKLSLGLLYNYNHTICFGWMGDIAACPADLVIEDGVEEISPSAFEECAALRRVTLPESVKKIGESAFLKCENLEQINMPRSIESIGANAFFDCHKLGKNAFYNLSKGVCLGWKRDDHDCPTKIVIPEGVTIISERAFESCWNLREVVFPSTLEVIETSAFEACESLKMVHFPDNLKKIGCRAFKECRKLRRAVLGAGLEELEYEAFQSCEVLDGIVLPPSLKSIGDECFKGCKSLSKINISDNTEEMGDEVFADCVQLSQVETDGLRYGAFGMDDFENTAIVNRKRKEGELFIIDHTVVDGRHCKGEVTIPDGVCEIGVGAFKNCVELTRIDFPKTMKSISYRAFEGCTLLDKVKLPVEMPFIAAKIFKDCTSLTEIELPDKFGIVYDGAFENTPWLQNQLKEGEPLIMGETLYDGSQCSGALHFEKLTAISGGAFRGNLSLTGISVGEGLKYVGEEVFSRCESLERVNLPSGVESIGAGCFSNCHSLESIEIPEGVKIIRRRLFENCSSLRCVKLPNSITGVWREAFSYCPQLRKPDVPAGAWVSDSAFYRMEDDSRIPKRETIVPIEKSAASSWKLRGSVLCVGCEAYIERNDLVEVVIPDGVKVIEKEAFCYCRNLRKVVLPDSVEIIEERAFSCTGIVTINFPKNLRVIGTEAFRQTKMKSVVLPEGVESIGEKAFYESEMVSLLVPSTVTEICGLAFAGCLSLTDATFLSIPNLHHDRWYAFAYREPSGFFQNCSRLNRFESPGFPIDEEHFEGTPLLRPMDDREGDFRIVSGCLVATRKNLPALVEVPDGVLSIASEAFKGQKNMEKVSLPETLRVIGNEAFAECSRLEEVNLPKNLISMGIGVFQKCGFKCFDWPAHLTSLPSNTFEDCSSLRELVLPETLELLQANALNGCQLQTLTILSEACRIDSTDVKWLSDQVETILWRGDISSVTAPYSVGRFCVAEETRKGQILLLNHYTKGLELGFDYGEACMERNDRMIRSFVNEKPSTSPFQIKCLEFLNTILHIIFLPYIWLKEMKHMCSPNHQPSYFFDDTLMEMYMERRWESFVTLSSESMVRYLKRNGLWPSSVSEDA